MPKTIYILLLIIVLMLVGSLSAVMDQTKINAYTAVNAATPLDIPSYHPSSEGYDEILHPDVLYIPGGWNGYAYWMAFTPFPNTNENSPTVNPYLNPIYENPSIVASHDGINWVLPAGLTNPIDLLEVSASYYNSDTELIFSPDGLTLYCVWREFRYFAGNTYETMFYRSSTNGTTWSARTQMLQTITAGTRQVLLSPSILYEDGVYKLWYVQKADGSIPRKVVYREAATLTGAWSDTLHTNISPFAYNSSNVPTQETWHINVIFHNGYYWMINQVGPSSSESGGNLYLGYSSDGIHWTFGASPVLLQNPWPAWDWILYRASIIPQDAFSNDFKIWYSTIRKQWMDSAPCKIGYTVTTGGVPNLPVSVAATAICQSGFTARWNVMEGATSYRLDVLQSDGVTYVPGYQNITVSNTLARVENLNSSTAYKYRVRGYNDGASLNSNITDVTTTASVQGVSASTSILGNPVTVVVPPVSGGPAITDNNIIINPDDTASNDFTVNVSWNPAGYGTLPDARLVCAVNCSDFNALNGTYTINHTGMGFTPTSVRYKYGSGTWQTVAFTPNENFTTFTIVGILSAAKSELIIALNDGAETLPVELSSFTAIPTALNYVRLDWITQSETNVLGYYIYRNTTESFSGAQLVSPLITASNTSHETAYSYTDTDLSSFGTYYYWLQNQELDGTHQMFGPISATLTGDPGNPPPVIPVYTKLQRVYPNPFNPSVTIAFGIAKAGAVKLEIHNLKGEKVCTILSGSLSAGNYHRAWNGTGDKGNKLTSDIYFVKLTSGKDTSIQKIVYLK